MLGATVMLELNSSAIATLLCFALAHTGALVWFLSRLSTTVAYQSKQIEALTKSIETWADDRYTQENADRDMKPVAAAIDSLAKRVSALESRHL